ncbi:polymer-forming cytoskeletal protein [Paenibacillus sp. TAB 01]|uniref:polymer-forming cytoskeletal protein n=1 Tax=Paenibacillus sp. TAB 01 TaxID=3368988 RepID=UPI0037537BA3
MEQEKKRDQIINGQGTTSGGSFRQVKINGDGTVHGDVECTLLHINGRGELEGGLKAEEAEINGSARIGGAVEAKRLKVNGESSIDGSLACDELKVKGNIKIKGQAAGETIRLEGGATIEGDCQAETFEAKGGFQIQGLLNAGVVDVTMYFSCRAQEIGGEKITVRPKSGLSTLLNPFLPKFAAKHLYADVIEGDEIVLELTTAKVVRGNRVTLGPGCEIELVEYKQSLEADPGARIQNSRQI